MQYLIQYIYNTIVVGLDRAVSFAVMTYVLSNAVETLNVSSYESSQLQFIFLEPSSLVAKLPTLQSHGRGVVRECSNKKFECMYMQGPFRQAPLQNTNTVISIAPLGNSRTPPRMLPLIDSPLTLTESDLPGWTLQICIAIDVIM